MTLLDRQKEFTNYLVSGFPEHELKGLPLKSACAATGNGSQENSMLAVTTGPKDHGSDGVMQWRLDRLDGPSGLKGWAQINRLDWATLKTQAAFFLWELHKDYPGLESDLRAGEKKIETLTANICFIYERPSAEFAALDTRISHARSVYQIMSAEKTAAAAKTGSIVAAGGGAVIAAANQAAGGSPGQSIALLAIMAAIAALMFFVSRKQLPTALDNAPMPNAEPDEAQGRYDPAPASLTTDLDAAMAKVRSCKTALDEALKVAAEERQKMHARIETLQAADLAAANEVTAIKESVSEPKRLVAPEAPRAESSEAHIEGVA